MDWIYPVMAVLSLAIAFTAFAYDTQENTNQITGNFFDDWVASNQTQPENRPNNTSQPETNVTENRSTTNLTEDNGTGTDVRVVHVSDDSSHDGGSHHRDSASSNQGSTEDRNNESSNETGSGENPGEADTGLAFLYNGGELSLAVQDVDSEASWNLEGIPPNYRNYLDNTTRSWNSLPQKVDSDWFTGSSLGMSGNAGYPRR